MKSKEEKLQRQAIENALRENERQRFVDSLPASREDLQALLDFVGGLEEPCDHTLKKLWPSFKNAAYLRSKLLVG